jgi:hypothetical protein
MPPRKEPPPPPTVRLGVELDPNVYPFVWNVAVGALPADDAALATAARRAEGLAPRMVSVTVPLVNTRKVGMLEQR